MQITNMNANVKYIHEKNIERIFKYMFYDWLENKAVSTWKCYNHSKNN